MMPSSKRDPPVRSSTEVALPWTQPLNIARTEIIPHLASHVQGVVLKNCCPPEELHKCSSFHPPQGIFFHSDVHASIQRWCAEHSSIDGHDSDGMRGSERGIDHPLSWSLPWRTTECCPLDLQGPAEWKKQYLSLKLCDCAPAFVFVEYYKFMIPTDTCGDQQHTCISASGDSTNASEDGATEVSVIDSMQEINSRGPRYRVLRIWRDMSSGFPYPCWIKRGIRLASTYSCCICLHIRSLHWLNFVRIQWCSFCRHGCIQRGC